MSVKAVSGHRQRQAEATKERSLRAARGLFSERGYAATTVKAISEASDIPEQTIYSSLGSKAQILARITEQWMRDSQTTEVARAYFEEREPDKRLRMFAALNRQQLDLGGDVLAIYPRGFAGRRKHRQLAGMLAAREREIGIHADPGKVDATGLHPC